MHQTEGLRVVEGGVGQDGHGIPAQAVGLYRQITALVAVGPDGIAGYRGESREELPDKGVGDSICNLPATVGVLGLGQNAGLFRDKTHQIVAVGSQSQIQRAVGVTFDVEVPGVTCNGAEEKFQTAVFTDLSERSVVLCTNVFFYRGQTDMQGFVIIANLRLGLYRDVCVLRTLRLADDQGRDLAPVQGLGAAQNGVFFHCAFSFDWGFHIKKIIPYSDLECNGKCLKNRNKDNSTF